MLRPLIGAAMAALCLAVGFHLGKVSEAGRLAVLEERARTLEVETMAISMRIERLRALGLELHAEAFHGHEAR